jgi:hypothetical protein
MTGRERIEAALSPGGSPEIPAVICYEDIYVRDHWSGLTDLPWWYREAPDVERQLRWREEVMPKIGQDWFDLPSCRPRRERDPLSIVERPDGVCLLDAGTGSERRLEEPVVGGWPRGPGVVTLQPPDPPFSVGEVDRRVRLPGERSAADVRAAGEADLADALLAGPANGRLPTGYAGSPFWLCYHLWGFEELMVAVARTPDLVRHACARLLAQQIAAVRHAAALGAQAIWVEECLTDWISPDTFSRLSSPPLEALIREIHALGMAAVYYYCGDPSDRWNRILAVGADALALEEGKKGFAIDIEEVVGRVGGRMCVLGNLDAIHLLEHGSDADLAREIGRQIRAGRRNGSRFVTSIGSPVTPGTRPERVRRFLSMAREMGAGPA